MKIFTIVAGSLIVLAVAGCSSQPGTTDAETAPSTTTQTQDIAANTESGTPSATVPATDVTSAPLPTENVESAATGSATEATRAVEIGDTVQVHYVGTLTNGETFDSSRERGEPLEFVVGDGQLIEGFDLGVVGMVQGATRTLNISPQDGYGERSDDNVVEPDATPEEMEGMAVGDTVYVNDGTIAVEIVSIGPDTITVDANHPLSGETLIFEVELVSVIPGN